MNILITGGLGYVGGRLADHLKSRHKDTSIFLATTRSYYPFWSSQFSLVHMELGEVDSIRAAIEEVKPKIIVHLAGLDKQQCEADPQRAAVINTEGTKHLLNIAGESGVEKFLYFSTSQVYGPLKGEVTEQTPLQPSNPYAQSKKEAEDYISAFKHKRLKTLIFRLSNGYGFPRDTSVSDNVWSLMFIDFCYQALRENKITVRSDQYRDFIALSDVARAVNYFLFETNEWGEGIFNLGSGQTQSTLEMAQKISHILNEDNLTVECLDSESIKMKERFTYNVERLKSTGFSLRNDIEEEVAKTVEILNPNKSSQPLVSVVMPTFNHAHFIEKAIDSVLKQSYANLELIVVDNFSKDNTQEIVESFNDKRVQYYKFANKGIIAASRNHGILKAKGKYIAFIDSDDFWLEEKLKKQVAALEDDPSAALAFTQFRVSDPQGDSDGKIFGPKNRQITGHIYDKLLKANFVTSSSAVVRASTLKEVGAFDESEEFRCAEDFDLWLRVTRLYNAAYIDEVCGVYRKHNANTATIDIRLEKALNVIDKHYAKGWVPKSQAHRAKANYCVLEGWALIELDVARARKCLKEALKFSQGSPKILLICLAGFAFSCAPGFFRHLRQSRIDKKIGNLFFNSQDL